MGGDKGEGGRGGVSAGGSEGKDTAESGPARAAFNLAGRHREFLSSLDQYVYTHVSHVSEI